MPETTTPKPSPAKICIACGQDCSTKPRTKDLQGRYTCRECLEKAQRQAAAPAHKMAPPAAAPAAAARPGTSDPIPLEDDGDPNLMHLLLQDAVKEQAKVTVSPCPGCGNPLRSDTAICVNCGYNTRTGGVVKTKQAKPEEINPEAVAKAKGRQRDREIAAAAARMEYIKPIIMIVAGLTITSTLLGSMDGGGGAAIGGYFILYGISAFLTIIAYLLCVIMWLGSDAPLIIIITRLMGICAVMDVLLVGIFARIPFVGFGFIGLGYRFVLPLVIYAGFLAHMMEIEWEEALMVGVITGFVKVVGTIAIAYWIASTFG